MPDDYSGLAYALSGYGLPQNPYIRRRQYGYQLMQQGSDTSPILSPWQGVGRLAQAIAGGVDLAMTDRDEKAAQKQRTDALAQAMAEPDPQKRIGLLASYDPNVGAQAAGQLAVKQAELQQQQGQIGALAKSYGMPGPSPTMQAGGGPAPTDPTALDPHFQNASAATGLPISLLKAVASTESGIRQFNPDGSLVTSPAGNQGVMQLGTGAAADTGVNRADIGQNILGGAKYLRQMVDRYGNLPTALVAYNWGPGNTDAWLRAGRDPSKLPAETQGYLAKVLGGPQQPQPGVSGIQPIPNYSGPPATPQPIPNAVPGQAPQIVPAGGPPGTPPPQQNAQGAPTGMPPAPSPAGVSAPAMVVPQIPQHLTFDTMPPEMKAQFVQKLAGGGYGFDPRQADAAMRAEVQGVLDRQYEAQKLNYDRQLGDYTAARAATEHDRQQNTATPSNDMALAAGFADRMTRSNGILAQMPPDVLASVKGKISEAIPFGAGNFLQSPAYIQAKQARDDFINAQLRRESGAAIAPSEYANADRQYFPQPNDPPEVLQQKALNRQLAIEGMVRGAGPTYRPSPSVNAPQALAGSSAQSAPSAAPQPGAVMDGYRFKGGDPSKKENWEAAQ